MSDSGRINRMAENSANAYRKARAKLFLEAAIATLLQSYTIAEVAQMLRDHSDHLNQFG